MGLCSQRRGYANLRADAVAVACLSDELNLDPRFAVATIVSEEVCGSVGGRNEQIPVPVVVDIAVGAASANQWLCQVRADLMKHIGEFALGVVMK